MGTRYICTSTSTSRCTCWCWCWCKMRLLVQVQVLVRGICVLDGSSRRRCLNQGQATLHCGGLAYNTELIDIQHFLLLAFSYSTRYCAALHMNTKTNFMSS